MRHVWALAVAVTTLSACARSPTAAEEIGSQKGRWVAVPRQANNPLILLDTVTGCVASVVTLDDGRIAVLEAADRNGDKYCAPKSVSDLAKATS